MGSLTKEDEKSPKILEKCEFIWTICKFTEIYRTYNKNGSVLYSSFFPKANSKYKWRLMLYPKSFDEKTFELNLGIANSGGGRIPCECTITVKNSKDEILNTKKISLRNIFMLTHYDINREKLIDSLHDDCFQIHASILAEISISQPPCTVCKERDALQNEKKQSEMKLSRDLQALFQSSKFSDFVIKFEDDNDILVHKTVLTARSPVFSAMFEHDTFENKNGFVKISDIDKDTMECLLYFMYAGCIKGLLSEDKAKKLLFAADKYEIQDLKNLCAETLLQNVNTFNALDILQLAERYYLAELKDSTAQYILKHFKEISDPKAFREIEKKFPGLITELLIMAKSDK